MTDVDLKRMEEALTVSRAKLRSRGVPSARSRVVNLKEYCPGLETEQLCAALTEAFGEVYGLTPEELDRSRLDEAEIRREAEWLGSDEWILGRQIPFSAAMEDRFSWGGIRIELDVRQGKVKEAACRSDAMDEEIIRKIGEALAGCPYDGAEMANRVLGTAGETETLPARRQIAEDAARMIREQTGETVRGQEGP